ncbi:transposase [Micromonospora sp. NPDC005806]|uniref:transposase n=1 Tax=Micromonospora sp. NPDC005806 TaxID=3364234 RepID=UPI00368FECDA
MISDAHRGLAIPVGAALPGPRSQGSARTSYLREPLIKVPKPTQPWIATLVRSIFDQPDVDAVRAPVEPTR